MSNFLGKRNQGDEWERGAKEEREREGKNFEILDATVPEAHRPLALLS